MAIIVTSGIVTNEYNHTLLIQRSDSRTWAPPGGALELDELPPAGVSREVREETGLIVMPVRLVAVYHVPINPDPLIIFMFRCIQRGGEIQTSEESLQVGWFKDTDLPRPMMPVHKTRIERALRHAGGTPILEVEPQNFNRRLSRTILRNIIHPFLNARRQRLGGTPHQSPPAWQIGVEIVAQDASNRVLLYQMNGDGQWALPGGLAANKEPAWETAVSHVYAQTGHQINITTIARVAFNKKERRMDWVFRATVSSDAASRHNSAFFAVDQLPQNLDPTTDAHLATVDDDADAVVFTWDPVGKTKGSAQE